MEDDELEAEDLDEQLRSEAVFRAEETLLDESWTPEELMESFFDGDDEEWGDEDDVFAIEGSAFLDGQW
jgi:hypothetical protein